MFLRFSFINLFGTPENVETLLCCRSFLAGYIKIADCRATTVDQLIPFRECGIWLVRTRRFSVCILLVPFFSIFSEKNSELVFLWQTVEGFIVRE